jgi:N-acyl-phosphatidylethanolamine-hydrolysing phospholipase D
VFSLRASPFSWLGPARFLPPPIAIAALPPIDAVILSHDHYDHLDAASVRRIARRFPGAPWVAPLGHDGVLRTLGVRQIKELDWWETTDVGGVTITAAPSQHWTRRIGSPMGARLWFSCGIRSAAHNIFFSGDSGYCPVFSEIGERLGPFDAALLPIGAYEPRWFMRRAHMNPEESVRACQDLGARHFLSMHWATFRLTDEHPLEPAERVTGAWKTTGLPEERLHVLGIGETFCLPGC